MRESETPQEQAADQATHASGTRNAEIAGSDAHVLASRSRQAKSEAKG